MKLGYYLSYCEEETQLKLKLRSLLVASSHIECYVVVMVQDHVELAQGLEQTLPSTAVHIVVKVHSIDLCIASIALAADCTHLL